MHSNTTPHSWLDLINSYLGWLASGGIAAGTLKLRRYQLERFALEIDKPASEVRLDDVIDYFEGRKWSGATVRSVRAALRGFYRWGCAVGRLDDDPTRLLRPLKHNARVRPPASEASIAEGLASVDRRVRLMVRLGAEVGLRCCEIALVNSGDVFEDLVGYSLVVHGKGGKRRIVPIEPDLALIIARCQGWLFPGQIDGHLSAKYISKLLSRAMSKATGHQLRHRFGTVTYDEGGKDLRAVQELLGHSSLVTTQIYVHVGDAAKRRAAAAAVVRPGVALAS
ncbi:tyrosine-type recombinase/integrase [Gryllotalpicola koreensis]|uniref:Tyrosine-type recombinase/integrase n=1 Tax=Gryllotalpicola koreensis TaxID=993086 RepID=A0ABP8A6W2_9MICO